MKCINSYYRSLEYDFLLQCYFVRASAFSPLQQGRIVLVLLVLCLISGRFLLVCLFFFLVQQFIVSLIGVFVVLSYPVRWPLVCLP